MTVKISLCSLVKVLYNSLNHFFVKKNSFFFQVREEKISPFLALQLNDPFKDKAVETI